MFNQTKKVFKDNGKLDEENGYKECYVAVKTKLMQFLENPTERQLRVRNEFEVLHKGTMDIYEFETEWMRITTELDEVGLTRNEHSLYLDYISKIGPTLGKLCRTDRRERKNRDGDGMIVRESDTWNECHELLNITLS